MHTGTATVAAPRGSDLVTNKEGKTMIGMNWVKGAVVSLGLALTGGSALAAPGGGPYGGPGPSQGDYRHDHDGRHDGNWNGNGGWNGGWGGKDFNRVDYRLERLGKQKVAEGRLTKERGERLMRQARYMHSFRMAERARKLIARGERLENEGFSLIARSHF